MVKITYNPIKELVINEIITYDNLEEWEKILLQSLIRGQQVVLRWTEGVLFSYTTLPISETIIKDRLKGILYIDSLHYIMMPKYQPTRTIEPKEGGRYTYSIVDVSKTANLAELAKWIKKYDKSKR